MSLRWDGIDEVLGELAGIGDRAADGARGALGLAMEHIAGASAPLVPLETGALVGSRKVTVDGDTATIEYGTPYARYQHERLDLRHEHGQAKYLEQPMRTEADNAVDVLGDAAWRAM